MRRVRADRTRLLWKLRLSGCQSTDQKVYFSPCNPKKESCFSFVNDFGVFMFQEIINSALQDIVSDELKKIEDSSRNLSVTTDSDDILWEYEGVKYDYEGDSEEILLEMQQMFYKDLISETTIDGKTLDEISMIRNPV